MYILLQAHYKCLYDDDDDDDFRDHFNLFITTVELSRIKMGNKDCCCQHTINVLPYRYHLGVLAKYTRSELLMTTEESFLAGSVMRYDIFV